MGGLFCSSLLVRGDGNRVARYVATFVQKGGGRLAGIVSVQNVFFNILVENVNISIII